jgi:hypothetical protein
MALQKQPIDLAFVEGLETKTDSKRVQIGKFLELENTKFTKAGALVKRDGYPKLSSLPNANQTTLATLNNNLLATGTNLYAYNQNLNEWIDRGTVEPITLSTQSLVRINTSQSSADVAIMPNGSACVVYKDTGLYYYQVFNSQTGETITTKAQIPSGSSDARVYVLGNYFVVLYKQTVSSNIHIKFTAISAFNPSNIIAPQDLCVDVNSINSGYDAYVFNNRLYVGYEATSSVVKMCYITTGLIVSTSIFTTSSTANVISVTAKNNTVYLIGANSTNGYAIGYNLDLSAQTLVKTTLFTGLTINRITSIVNTDLEVYYEVSNTYNFTPNNQTNYTQKTLLNLNTLTTTTNVLLRSVGLASKPFISNNKSYMLVTYGEVNQPTYFLTDSNSNIIMKLAYSNGGGYLDSQVLPQITLIGTQYLTPYLIKTQLVPVNKQTDPTSTEPVNAIYTQTGINLVKFSLNIPDRALSEVSNSLHITGGILWQYDSVKPVEHGFFIYPENITATQSNGGNIDPQTYFYSFCYEWTDNQGYLHRSAPSIPTKITTTGANKSVILKVPTLRLTKKEGVRIVGYRWSEGQQTYYQFTSLTSPTLNDTTIDNVTITDTLADSAILGNTILYTTGGVVENIAAPGCIHSVLFKNRLVLIDAETNLLWYSKPILQSTPVEMSDSFTLYVAPTSGAQGSTGKVTALGTMDDKLIVFKKDAIYYFVGTGPDITGANNDFSDPVFITSAVGCDNPKSIVLTPQGLMFQSDKGIWLLDRGLQTSYIGAPVEAYNANQVVSAQTVPGTNEVRFYLNNKTILVYDFYYGQWGSRTNLNVVSATLYNSKDTYLSNLGNVYQETVGTYLDGSTPVLIKFRTSWISLAGIQGLERFYEMYILGEYFTPFKLNVQIAYDFNPSPEQNILVIPDNYAPSYGADPLYGDGKSWGGSSNIFKARVFPEKQKCETFQIIIEEVYDPSYNIVAGQGLSLSGLNLIVGMKRGYRTNKSGQSFG